PASSRTLRNDSRTLASSSTIRTFSFTACRCLLKLTRERSQCRLWAHARGGQTFCASRRFGSHTPGVVAVFRPVTTSLATFQGFFARQPIFQGSRQTGMVLVVVRGRTSRNSLRHNWLQFKPGKIRDATVDPAGFPHLGGRHREKGEVVRTGDDLCFHQSGVGGCHWFSL